MNPALVSESIIHNLEFIIEILHVHSTVNLNDLTGNIA